MGFGRSCLEGLVTPRTQAGPDSRGTRSELSPACRSCGAALTETFADLGSSPLANSFLTRAQLDDAEPFYPLRVLVCNRCFLVQSPPVVTPDEIFGDYAYFSSFSDSFVEHARRYAEQMIHAAESGRVEQGRRGREQRRLLAEELRPARDPRPRHRTCWQRRRNRPGGRHSDPGGFLQQRACRDVEGRRPGGRSRRGEQRARPRARPERLHERPADTAQARWRRHGRVPAPPAPDRAIRVRHDLPRTPFLLLASLRRTSAPARWADGVRRGGGGDARRISARLRVSRTPPDDAKREWRPGGTRSASSDSTDSRRTSRSTIACESPSATCSTS